MEMLQRATFFGGSNGSDWKKPTIIFQVSNLEFSDIVLKMVESEFVDADIVRASSLDAASALLEDEDRDVRLLVLGEEALNAILSKRDPSTGMPQNVQLAFAYSDAPRARQIRQKLQATALHSRLTYLPIGGRLDVWLPLLRVMLAGQDVVPAELLGEAPQAISANETSAVGGETGLTQREAEILKRLSDGLSNKGIAAELGRSEHTVKLHVCNIYRKLGVRNRASATAWFLSRNAQVRTR